MSAHTPGPYELKTAFIEPASKRCHILVGPNGQSIAFVNIWFDAEEEAEANGYLLRAAPTLLQRLEETALSYHNASEPPAYTGEESFAKCMEESFAKCMAEMCVKNREAIAAAKGEEEQQ